jgi:hypothetical protein
MFVALLAVTLDILLGGAAANAGSPPFVCYRDCRDSRGGITDSSCK